MSTIDEVSRTLGRLEAGIEGLKESVEDVSSKMSDLRHDRNGELQKVIMRAERAEDAARRAEDASTSNGRSIAELKKQFHDFKHTAGVIRNWRTYGLLGTTVSVPPTVITFGGDILRWLAVHFH